MKDTVNISAPYVWNNKNEMKKFVIRGKNLVFVGTLLRSYKVPEL